MSDHFCAQHQPRKLEVTELTVMCVPWQGDFSKRHTAISGQSHRLKGVVKVPDNALYYYKWAYGDGTESGELAFSTGQFKVNIEKDYTYTGAEGTPFTARLIVRRNGEQWLDAVSCDYKVHIQSNNLDSRINVAIDNGLWFIYKTGSGASSAYRSFNGEPVVVWSYSYFYASPTVSSVTQFIS